VATIACPSCGKAIDVPQKKLGRWIACPVCNMEFAALADEADRNEKHEPVDEPEDPPTESSSHASRLVLPLALLLVVALAGLLAYAAARHSSKKAVNQPVETVPADRMPKLENRTNEDPFGLGSLQGGSLDSVMGIGSSIQSFFWWTTVLSVVFLITSVAMLIWMAKDSRNRGMEGIASWIMPILFFNILAFLVYFFSRPQGKLVNCRFCANRCLDNAMSCPHCRRNNPTRKKKPRFDD
jgi:hypothetical protein